MSNNSCVNLVCNEASCDPLAPLLALSVEASCPIPDIILDENNDEFVWSVDFNPTLILRFDVKLISLSLKSSGDPFLENDTDASKWVTPGS